MHSGWPPRLRAGAGAGAVQASAPGLSLVPRRRMHIPELEEAEHFAAGRGRALRLLEALYQCVAAHSELLCYFVIVLNHMVTASATSLVLPVLVFLWAMLSIPRPSKRFWMTAIVFTEVGVAGGVGVGEGAGATLTSHPCRSRWSPSTCSSLASSRGTATLCCGAMKTSPTSRRASWAWRRATATSSMTCCSSWRYSSTAHSCW